LLGGMGGTKGVVWWQGSPLQTTAAALFPMCSNW
jgi:hypothetical protein